MLHCSPVYAHRAFTGYLPQAPAGDSLRDTPAYDRNLRFTNHGISANASKSAA